MSKKKVSSLELLYFFSSLFMVFLLLMVLYFSFVYWNNNYPHLAPIDAKMFYVAIGIVIATVIAQWIEGRIRAIQKSWDKMYPTKITKRRKK